MQYIQLQPQIAGQVPFPVTGNLNVFIDNSDNVVKAVDDNGIIYDPNNNSGITGGTYSDGTLTLVNVTGGTIDITGITATNLIEVTYSGLVNNITGETLTTGAYYIITDFKTCYDVPEYYVNGNAKGSNAIQYNQASVDPIIVLATSTNTISSTAYQPAYPNDRIQYDWTWNSTEISGGTAYGRITERIDEFNNRTDYDHRNIYFNRFQSYNQGSQLTGTINSYDSGTGVMSGNSTLFLSEVEIGDILFFEYQNYLPGVKVVSAITNTQLIVVVDPTFGDTINFSSGSIPLYSTTSTGNYYEYKEVYIGQKNEGDWDDTLTFNLNGSAIHNYVGDYSKFYINEIGSNSGFLLANNVFYGNRTYSNTIGDRSYNNTGTYWFSRNTIAGRFYNNVIHNNGFYSNSIGEYFDNNIIKGYMWNNTIEQYFENNKIYNQFYDNQIGNGFYQNVINSQFYENNIGVYFEYNIITQQFYRNEIGVNFNGNELSGETNNNLIGYQFENNTILGIFANNIIGNQFKGNLMFNEFSLNDVKSFISGNEFSGYTSGNYIGDYTFDNTFLGEMIGNSWKGDFYQNTIGNVFNANSFYGEIFSNTIGANFYSNRIQNYFTYNTIGNGFQTNEIGNYFNYNTIGDNFGYGYANPQGNKIGSNFYNNTVGEYFYNNSIPDNFYQNEIGNYFQWNVINTNINDTNFTLNYGNITGFSYTASGTTAADSLYLGIQICGATESVGVDAKFNIEVLSGSVIGVSGATEGRLYQNGDVLTILGTQIGGYVGVIDSITSDAIGKSGITGSYTGTSATGGNGNSATFDIIVLSGLVTDFVINNGGNGYLVGDTLTILGNEFGGVDGVDDITITVDSIYSDNIVITVTGTSEDSLFYQHYTKQIFERRGTDKRVSYYDENDVLNVDSVYINSGYIPVYTESLTFPHSYTSFEYRCDGVYTNIGGYTNQTVNNMTELVVLFNNNFRNNGYFFDNNDGNLGLYINPSLKQQYCPSGVYTINVFND